jgi:hypothetical protein
MPAFSASFRSTTVRKMPAFRERPLLWRWPRSPTSASLGSALDPGNAAAHFFVLHRRPLTYLTDSGFDPIDRQQQPPQFRRRRRRFLPEPPLLPAADLAEALACAPGSAISSLCTRVGGRQRCPAAPRRGAGCPDRRRNCWRPPPPPGGAKVRGCRHARKAPRGPVSQFGELRRRNLALAEPAGSGNSMANGAGRLVCVISKRQRSAAGSQAPKT